ncbi:MAG: acyl-ACP--UDP-N-acetylglucosamine O-acyltransferase [Simkania sp.]|nr:acyl-ACP--UDP-N-acetylglucosamine O-acyltransferase [Simkania sp.]MCB1074846.1 acyl-ACP--UDP-N-acetylglucosamine O-acyltransferase [Simkania sp.]MCP5489727.1 acyl-ACP--UDP-N-acetylglucosamine O-acyltransferase [Chlamydiales bacterium]
MSNIHPTAIIEPGAIIGNNVTIEPYAIVKGNVTIGNNVVIKSHAYIDGFTTIGDGTVIYPSASIGTKTQDLKFQGEKTFVTIGKNCEIREFVTINSSCQEGTTVSVGDNCLIMAYCHIAHNCEIGNHVIMANGAMLAGHVIVEDFAIIGGMTPIHQFVRVGSYAMVGGLSRITNDIPPFTLGAGVPYRLGGLNLIGLKRHNFRYEMRKDLSQAFRLTYRSGYHLDEALEQIEKSINKSKPIEHWLNFCRTSKRGLIGLQGVTHSNDDEIGEYQDLLEE